MTNLNLDKLKEYKDEILKVEIGSLLFNLGKTHIGFWKEKKEEGNKIIYFHIDEQAFQKNFGFKPFSGYKQYYNETLADGKTPFEYELEKYELKDFIFNTKVKFPFSIKKKHEIDWVPFFKGDAVGADDSAKDFIQKIFIRGCENINSGIDKGSPKLQLKPLLWIANAFGTFKEEVKEYNFDERRNCFFRDLKEFLDSKGYYTEPNWKEIRNFILGEIKAWYSHLLSDSRFPINDITLFDQAYMTASMFKAVIAQLVMENISDIKSHDYYKNPTSIKWRILGIQYDKLGLAEKSLKLTSIQWYREITEKIDNEIKKLLEIEYPIGNEIYRDETGIYFIVGEYLLKPELEEVEEKIYEIFESKTDDEFYPAIFLTKASRGLMNLSTLLEEAKENFLKTKIKKKDLNVTLDNSVNICQICKIRLVTEEDRQRNAENYICKVCDRRIEGFTMCALKDG